MRMTQEEMCLQGRLRRIRDDIYGEQGIPELANALGITAQDWEYYESGEEIPGTVLLRFVCLTGADPLWLLTGRGWPFAPRTLAADRPSFN